MLKKLISNITTIKFSFISFCAILVSERRTPEVTEIKDKKRRYKMDILITMAYTALMTFIMVKVTEKVPSSKKK